MKHLALSIALIFSGSLTAHAGEQYIDSTGFAVSGYDVVAYHNLEQAPIGSDQPAAIPGKADITAEYNGATFSFASKENREKFLQDPAKYVPQYDGHCAYGVAVNNKVPGNPNLWRIVDGKLYLNITENIADRWQKDILGNLTRSEGNWPELEDDKASTDAIPSFTSSAPVGK